MSSEVVVGTVSEDGRYLATVERRGEIRVFQTFGYQTGGLGCEEIVSYQAGELNPFKRPTFPFPLQMGLTIH